MSALTEAVVREAETFGHAQKTSPTDRRDVPIDNRFLELLLEVAGVVSSEAPLEVPGTIRPTGLPGSSRGR